MKIVLAICSLLVAMPCATLAFVPLLSVDRSFSVLTRQEETSLDASRRDFVETITRTTVLSTAALLSAAPARNAMASGGATAGGAYLLSAKQRYNERVKGGVKGFLGLQADLEAGNLDPLRAYFANEDAGGWKDFSSAAYLLANAFRRNSTAAPDSLPTVKVSSCVGSAIEMPENCIIPLFLLHISLKFSLICRRGKSLLLPWKP